MNEETANKSRMIDTTDCLEAVGVFRGWKNFFFAIVAICLLLVQVFFWLVNTGSVSIPAERLKGSAESSPEPGVTGSATADANDATTAMTPVESPAMLDWLGFDKLSRMIELVDGILVVTAALYCMAMFFSLMVSLIGRLGGINHISRAFFLSLILLVLIVPWQKALGMNVFGAVYTPGELVTWFSTRANSPLNTILYYLRFSGYWLVVFVLLLMSQMRGVRWSNAILRRLEII
jgi:hypothetical protein